MGDEATAAIGRPGFSYADLIEPCSGNSRLRKGGSFMRQGALLLSIMLGVVATPAMADPPDIENADHITGCLDRGRLLSFEVSGWGAYKPCFKHGPEAEWITLQRANQNSRAFTIRPSGGSADGFLPEGLVPDGVPLTEIVTVGSFTLYGSGAHCN